MYRDPQFKDSLFRTVLDSMAEGVVITDKKGKFLLWNKQAIDICFPEEAGARPQSVEDLNAWSDRFRLLCPDENSVLALEEYPLFRAMQGETVKGFHLVIERSDGSLRHSEVTASPIHHGGKQFGAVALFRDTTEHEKEHRDLIQAQKLSLVGTLAGGIAHDFRNQLTIILGLAETAARRLKKDSKVETSKRLERIMSAAQRSSALTSQLLAFSRRQPHKRQPVDLNQLIENSLSFLEQLIPKHLRLEFSAGELNGLCHIDPVQLDQVILNLVTNAVEATPTKGKIQIRTYEEKVPFHRVAIEVEDEGVGIHSSVQDKLFEPFFTTGEKSGGTGLGLSVVYGIVTQNEGKIEVESQSGNGTRFTIYFPLHRERTLTKPAELGERPPIKKEPDRISKQVLLVEDDEDVGSTIAEVLGDRGVSVLWVQDADQAKRTLEQMATKVDLVLTDLLLAGDSGLDLAKSVRQLYPDLPVVIISGYPLDEKQLGEDKGIRFVSKPFTLSQLESLFDD